MYEKGNLIRKICGSRERLALFGRILGEVKQERTLQQLRRVVSDVTTHSFERESMISMVYGKDFMNYIVFLVLYLKVYMHNAEISREKSWLLEGTSN